jgi:hypothetical protein
MTIDKDNLDADNKASTEQDDIHSTEINSTASSKPEVEITEPKPQQKPKSSFTKKVAVVAVIAIAAIVYQFSGDDEPSQEELARLAKIEAIANFDERLLSCNDVRTAKPSEAFDTCLSLAKEGQKTAKLRMIWAYSRAGEHQDWQAVFNWLKSLRTRDKGSEFLMYAIMHLLSNDEALKKQGEKGINDLVTKNFAPAKVFMASIYALGENQLPPANNALWLLEKAHQNDPGAIDVSRIALLYANNFLGTNSVEKASELLERTAQKRYPINANNIAWFLSTIDENPFSTPKLALDLALSVIENEEHANNPIYVDTLAAAYAVNDMYEEAVLTQQNAIELLADSNLSEERIRYETEQFEKRLSLYKNQEPLVEETLLVEKEAFFRELKTSVIEYIFRAYLVRVNAPTLEANVGSQ